MQKRYKYFTRVVMRYLLLLCSCICSIIYAKPNLYEICTNEDTSRIKLTLDSDLSDIRFCTRIPGGMPRVAVRVDSCVCQSKIKDQEYCLPLLQSPKDPTYPCSPKMLEYYEIEQEKYYIERQEQCNQFIKNWNADKYECIFDKDSKKVDECYKTLHERYCG